MRQLMTILVAFLLASPVLAAGGLIENKPFLGDHVQLPGVVYDWHTNNIGEKTLAQVSLKLSNHKVQTSCWSFYWSFYADKEAPIEWNAYFSVSGFLLKEGEAHNYISRKQEGEIERGSISLATYTKLDEVMWSPWSEKEKIPYQHILGNFSLTPARVDSAYFSYDEHRPSYIGLSGNTSWEADFSLRGSFLGTKEEAEILGARFAPEPATLCLLGLGAVGVILRRRNKT